MCTLALYPNLHLYTGTQYYHIIIPLILYASLYRMFTNIYNIEFYSYYSQMVFKYIRLKDNSKCGGSAGQLINNLISVLCRLNTVISVIVATILTQNPYFFSTINNLQVVIITGHEFAIRILQRFYVNSRGFYIILTSKPSLSLSLRIYPAFVIVC